MPRKRELKIITGVRENPYWPDWYIASAFRKLGHTVTETDHPWGEGYDFGFAVIKMLIPSMRRCGYPLGFWGVDCAAYMKRYKRMAKEFDVFFVDRYDVVKDYEESCKKAVYLPWACDPEIHKCLPAKEQYDVGFAGRSTPKRLQLLQTLKKSGLKTKCYFSAKKKRAKKKPRLKFISWAEICLMYSECKMIFNTIKDATNSRVFEAMSMGKLLLTSRKGSEPNHLFVDGKHLVVYADEEDLVEKAKYYASHPTERRAIAKAGQQLVHRKHKWTDRMKSVIETMLE